jgi:DNA replication protein DnaC
MKISNLLPDTKAGLPDCIICGGTGLVLEVNIENSRSSEIFVCSCVSDFCHKCPSKNRPPYMVFDETTNKMIPCHCHQARVTLSAIEKNIDNAKIPQKYKHKFLENLDTNLSPINGTIDYSFLTACDWAETFIKEYKTSKRTLQGMYLYGDPGSGKTLLACTILNELIIRYGIDCKYAKISKDFLSALRDTYQKDSESYGQEKDIEKEFAEVDVLVIDDFGVQKDTEWANAKLYDLIDTRYEKEKLTLLTSNQPLSDWKEKGEGRVYSRLCEMTREIHLTCIDYRQRFHNQKWQ